MEINRYWREKLKRVNPGLFVEWHSEFGRNQIKHKDDRTGLIRNVMFVQDLDGNPCEINDNMINYLITSVEWDRIAKYPNPDDMWKSIEEDLREKKRKKDLEKQGFLLDFNHQNRKEWKKAMEIEMKKKHIADYLKREYMNKWNNRKVQVGFGS